MDIDNITELDLLRELAKRNRVQCIKDYDEDDMHFIKGYWYLYSAYYAGGVIIWINSDSPHYSKHIVISVDIGAMHFDLGI